MDMDVEAMLEAPYQEKPQVEESASQRSNGRSDSRSRDDHRRLVQLLTDQVDKWYYWICTNLCFICEY